jgi:cysteine synthase A
MILDAEKKGLKKGGFIIEPTSGNTGIGIALVSASLGYKAVIVMPDTMSRERIALMKAYGATVVLTDGKLGMKGSIDKAIEINKNTENSVILGQFDNPANPLAHYQTTAKEIYDELDEKVDVFIAGIGTGGAISGVGRYLKERNKNAVIIGVEPKSSPLISGAKSGAHKIQGIGANFIPVNFDNTVCDEIVTISDEDAYFYAKKAVKEEGLLVGISSGAVLACASKIAKRKEFKNKNIVAFLVDDGERYLSVDGFSVGEEINENLPQLIMKHDLINVETDIKLPDGITVKTNIKNAKNVWEDIILDAFGEHYDFSFMTNINGYKEENLFFLYDGNLPVATIGVAEKGNDNGKTGWYHMVAVKNSARGKGLGEILGKLALAVIKKKGYKCAMLSTDDHRIPAIKTYIKLGFKPCYTHESHFNRFEEILKKIK